RRDTCPPPASVASGTTTSLRAASPRQPAAARPSVSRHSRATRGSCTVGTDAQMSATTATIVAIVTTGAASGTATGETTVIRGSTAGMTGATDASMFVTDATTFATGARFRGCPAYRS